MKHSLQNILLEVDKQENKISLQSENLIDESYKMTLYLQDLLFSLKTSIVNEGFKNEEQEIFFLRTIKPHILGKLIYYNKVYRIETNCPVSNGKLYYSYFSTQLANLKREYIEHICNPIN